MTAVVASTYPAAHAHGEIGASVANAPPGRGNIKRLVHFYEQITGTPLTIFTEDFAELRTPSATLALGSTRTLQLFGGDVARAADNHTAIIEFLVDDVDAEYRKLAEVIKNSLVQEPTTMPWGNRSLLFRDPDGNLVNFFTPVTPEAMKKFKKTNVSRADHRIDLLQ